MASFTLSIHVPRKLFLLFCARLGELSAVQLLDCQTIDMEDWPMISDWMNRVVVVVSEADLAIKTDYLVVSSLGNDEDTPGQILSSQDYW